MAWQLEEDAGSRRVFKDQSELCRFLSREEEPGQETGPI